MIYAPAMRKLGDQVAVHGFAHVTGGGLPDNIARLLPDECDAVVHRGTWPEPRIFAEIQADGDVEDDEMEHVFNLGVGMVAVVAPGDTQRAVDALRVEGIDAWDIGEVVDGHGRAHVTREGQRVRYSSQPARSQAKWWHAGQRSQCRCDRVGMGSHSHTGKCSAANSA